VNANRVTYVDDLPFDVIFRITGRNENTPKNQFVSDGKTARKNYLINKEHKKIKLEKPHKDGPESFIYRSRSLFRSF